MKRESKGGMPFPKVKHWKEERQVADDDHGDPAVANLYPHRHFLSDVVRHSYSPVQVSPINCGVHR
jgi:hypothetical protein